MASCSDRTNGLLQLLNRKPPFGHEILACVEQYPEYTLEIKEAHVTPSDGESAVEVELLVECGLLQEIADAPRSKKGKSKFREATVLITVTSDLDFVDFRRIPSVCSGCLCGLIY